MSSENSAGSDLARGSEAAGEPSQRQTVEQPVLAAPTAGAALRLRKYGLPVLSVFFLIAVWEGSVRLGLLKEQDFPPPSQVLQTLWELQVVGFPRGTGLLVHIASTMGRVAAGYALAAVLAIPLGLVIGRSLRGSRMALPVITFARSVATLSLLPLAVVWFGVGEESKVFLITYGCFWVLLTNVLDGAKNVDLTLIRAALMLQTPRRAMFQRVILPSALPYIFSGLRLALGLGFMVIVGVELIGTSIGLGALISQARTFYRMDIVFAGMVVIGLFGLLIAVGLNWLERLLLPWARESK
ncbi:MAG: ABC transporter permease [Chloroflexota bacterium]